VKRRRDDHRVRTALREAAPPGERQAEARSWAVVREAFAEREPQRPRLALRSRVGLALAAGGAAAALVFTPAGAEMTDWIADAIEGEEDARPTLGALPAPGAILTESRDGVWVLRDDGSRRLLGDYDHATWSPNGLFVAVSAGRELFALTPQGEVRWTIRAPAAISAIDWSSDEGFRVAYVANDELNVRAGDATGDTLFSTSVGSAALAWRPESDPARAVHQLAYVQGTRVVLADTDSGRELWRSAPGARIESLQWSLDGTRLLVSGSGSAFVLDWHGEPVLKAVGESTGASLSPDGESIAVVRPSAKGGTEVALVPAGPGGVPEAVVYRTAPGAPAALETPTFSPDGNWLLVPWPDVNQWLFVRVADGRVVPVANISRQLDSDRRGPASFPVVSGWCC